MHNGVGMRSTGIDGTNLASLPMARCHAVRMIAEVLRDSPEMYWEHHCYRVTVTDDVGLTLFTVEMNSTDSAAIRPTTAAEVASSRPGWIQS